MNVAGSLESDFWVLLECWSEERKSLCLLLFLDLSPDHDLYLVDQRTRSLLVVDWEDGMVLDRYDRQDGRIHLHRNTRHVHRGLDHDHHCDTYRPSSSLGGCREDVTGAVTYQKK